MKTDALSFGAAAPPTGLVWTLVRTDFKQRYHGTIGGFAWALLKPFMMFLVLLSVFSFIFSAEPRYRLNLIIGIFLYEFFSEGTKTGLASLLTKSYLLTKSRFPSSVVVLASTSNAVITLSIFCAMLMVFLAVSGRVPGPVELVLFGVYLALYWVMIAGIALGSSVLFLRYRDLNQVWDVAIQAGFFIAPIIYPIGVIPERFHAYLYLWPPTPIIQFTRAVLVDGSIPTLKAHLLLAAGAATMFLLGLAVFRRYSPHAAEYV
jgi:lipopolysaccharide transport system permease protein